MILEQDVTERVLAENLSKQGVTVMRNTEVISFESDDEGVTATLVRRAKDGAVYDWYAANNRESKMESTPSAESTPEIGAGDEKLNIRARFFVACEGAHSSTRKKLGWKFEGRTINDEYVLADVDIVTDLPNVSGVVANSTSTVFIADLPNQKAITPNARRVRLGYRRGEIDAGLPQLTTEILIADVKKLVGPDVSADISNVTWMTSFKINERLSEKYVEDKHHRIMLAGDAAHCHSPAGGQGMNLGMQDAFNLAWKLALAVKRGGDSHKQLLTAYEQEQRPVAAGVLQLSSRLLGTMFGDGWFAQFVRGWILPNLPEMVRAPVALRNSQLTTRLSRTAFVDDSTSISQLNEFGQPGWRFPDALLIDSASGESVSLHQLVMSDAAFHLVTMLPQQLSAEQASQIKELDAFVAGLNGSKPLFDVRDESSLTQALPRPVRQLAAVTTIAPVDSTAPAKYRDSDDHNFQKAVSAKPSAWPACNDVLLVVVRPDGVVGQVASLATPDALARIKHYFSQL
ncbi:hypothetical protein GQ42DRAFT_161982 [Ramicandelaber brevisporus]|nr:hypothetical protein GQ42DRAFT_161982 [Ramicandelaber brevisporus]